MNTPAHDYSQGDGNAPPAKLEAKTLRELEDLYQVARAAREAYTAAIKATAEKTSIKASALRKIVRATMEDQLPDLHKELDDLRALLPETE